MLDILLNPDRDGQWVNRRLPRHVAPVAEVTWLAADGVRYLRPEIALLFKAKLHRAKDDRDLRVTWPLLSEPARGWLLDALAEVHPAHPWLDEPARTLETP